MGSFFQTDFNGLPPAAAGGGNLTLLYDSDAEGLTFPRANIDVQNISQSHLNLEIWLGAACAAVGVGADLIMYMNNDLVVGNYRSQNLAATSGALSVAHQAQPMIGGASGAGAPAGQMADVRIRIPNYADATVGRLATGFWTYAQSANIVSTGHRSYYWNSTNALNRLRFECNFGGVQNFVSPTRLIIMGEDAPS